MYSFVEEILSFDREPKFSYICWKCKEKLLLKIIILQQPKIKGLLYMIYLPMLGQVQT